MPLIINTDPKAYDGKWKEFLPGVSVLIRPYTRKLIRKIMALATVAAPAADGQPPAEARIDPELWDLHLYREIVMDIKGLVDPDNIPIARNDEAVDAVCDQVEGFAAWAMAESRADAAAMTVKQETETKNSKRSRDGKPAGQKD